jgi:flagellar basal-body rod protein FlgG
MARTTQMIDRQGELEPTGSALDLAIDGDGFIEVMGPDGQTLLWRGGRLSISAERMLATADGHVLQDQVPIPEGARDIRIDRNGAVSAKLVGSEDFAEVGRLSLTRVDDHEALERVDGGFYRVADARAVYSAPAGEDGAGSFVHGALERSNVELSEEMVRLMLVQRAYAANAQILQAADQLMGIANTLRR